MDGIETRRIAVYFGPRSKFVIIRDNSPDKTISVNPPDLCHLRSITMCKPSSPALLPENQMVLESDI